MEDIRIITTFDKIYELLKPEFNSGLISVVGSVLYHITGFDTKTDDSGDIDLIMNSVEVEMKLIGISKYIDDSITVKYEPNHTYRCIKLRFDRNLIETFRMDPKLVGVFTEIEYNSKIYKLYKQTRENQLDALLNLIIVLENKARTAISIYRSTPSNENYSNIVGVLNKLAKQIRNTNLHMENCNFDHAVLNNYNQYIIIKTNLENDLDIGPNGELILEIIH